ncbi:MAG: hypothetical protein JO316_08845 [Abitibacteriaceae bacterium]|nr:hypothetical protein [Abditibacteriaceae bacterium]
MKPSVLVKTLLVMALGSLLMGLLGYYAAYAGGGYLDYGDFADDCAEVGRFYGIVFGALMALFYIIGVDYLQTIVAKCFPRYTRSLVVTIHCLVVSLLCCHIAEDYQDYQRQRAHIGNLHQIKLEVHPQSWQGSKK